MSMKFGTITISPEIIFLRTEYSFAFINIRQSVRGRCLIAPKRNVSFFDELKNEEKIDLINAVKRVANVLKKGYGTEGIGITMQDGPAAGQTIPHVHFHVFPRNFPTKWSPIIVSQDVQEQVCKQIIDFFKLYDPEYVD